jgi:hypothetical protein
MIKNQTKKSFLQILLSNKINSTFAAQFSKGELSNK